MRALLQPVPNFGGVFGDFVLDVHFVFALAAPRQVGTGEQAVFAEIYPFELVEEIVGKALVAEEKPVFAAVAVGAALLHEGAERRDTCTRAYHNDGGVAVFGEAEMRVGFDEDTHFAAFFQTCADIAGGCAGVGVAVVVEADDTDGEVYFFADFVLRRGNGVQARGLGAEQAEQGLRIKRMRIGGQYAHGRGGGEIGVQFGVVDGNFLEFGVV